MKRCDNYSCCNIVWKGERKKETKLQHVLVRTDDVAKCTKVSSRMFNRQNNMNAKGSVWPSAALLRNFFAPSFD